MKVEEDGLDVLIKEINLTEIMSLIERTARWVDPETFKLLPVWYPEHARKKHFYKGDWSEPQLNKSRSTGTVIHKVEGNVYANKALTKALGLTKAKRPNWSCCQIWGLDDGKYQKSNVVVQDRRFYSCVANMVLLPTPMKAFTDTMPEVKAMLRHCASNLYGWKCDHPDLVGLDDGVAFDMDAYPKSWPTYVGEKRPKGTIELTPAIRKTAEKRLADIRKQVSSPGAHYPIDDVLAVLAYWKISVWWGSHGKLSG